MTTKISVNHEVKAYFNQCKKNSRATSIDVAKALGKSPQTISAMSGRLQYMSAIDLAKISRVFGLSFAEFIGGVLKLSFHETAKEVKP